MEIRKLATSRRGTALAAVLLTLGLATGTAASAVLHHAERDAASAALALRTAGVRAAVDTTFQRYADTVHDLVAVAATRSPHDLGPTVTRVVGERLPGAHEVLVVGADGAVLAQHAVDGSTPPPSARLAAGPDLDRAMRLARTRGRPVASSAHVLPADVDLPPAHRRPAFVLVAPVPATTTTGKAATTGTAATPAGGGWVLISVRARDLLETTLRGAGVTGVATVLAETSPDGATREVARWAEGGTTGPERGETVDVALAGHAWQLTVRPTAPLPGAGRTAAEALVLSGTVLAGLLLAALVVVLGVSRDRAVARAARADAERRDDARRALRAETALREREAELVGFAAAAGENLHAPLNNIAGFTDLLLEEAAPQLDEAARGFLDRIGHSTHRMLTLVDELLAYTAATDAALRLEHVDAAGLAAAAVTGRVAVPPDERPSIDVGPLPVVVGDAALLGQVVEQFVGNAVRFVRHGSTALVTVSARRSETGWWRIEVADRGIGVPAEHRERIFAPFHRTPAAEGFPGTGLGLATCRRIVTLHGGEIGVDPNPGGGSIFWFTVPGAGTGTHADGVPQLFAGHA